MEEMYSRSEVVS